MLKIFLRNFTTLSEKLVYLSGARRTRTRVNKNINILENNYFQNNVNKLLKNNNNGLLGHYVKDSEEIMILTQKTVENIKNICSEIRSFKNSNIILKIKCI